MSTFHDPDLRRRILPVCTKCGTEIDEGTDFCGICGMLIMNKNENVNGYSRTIDDLTDQLVAGSFAMISGRGFDELSSIVKDQVSIKINIVAIENMLFFHHIIDRYAAILFDTDKYSRIMKDIEPILVSKFARAGSVPEDNLGNFCDMYLKNLGQRNTEYSRFEFETVISAEISSGKEGILLDAEERKKDFATIFLSDSDVEASKNEGFESLQNFLLWQYSNKIAQLMNEAGSSKVIAYVHRYAIAFLFFTINPLVTIQNIERLLSENGER